MSSLRYEICKTMSRGAGPSPCAFIFSASIKRHKNWSVLLCRSNATSVLLSHLHTLRIHKPLQRIMDTNMHPTKCKDGTNCFATTAEMLGTSSSVFYGSLTVRNRNTRNHTTEKKGLKSVSGYIDVNQQGRQ